MMYRNIAKETVVCPSALFLLFGGGCNQDGVEDRTHGAGTNTITNGRIEIEE